MSETPARDPVTVAEGLTGALEGMTGQLRAVQRELVTMNQRLGRAETRQDRADTLSKRIRHLVVGLIVSFCLDLLVTAGFGYNTVRLNDTQNASRASLIAQCQQANIGRAEDVAIWSQFLKDLAPAGARTPKVQAELAGINRLISIKDKPRDCVAIYTPRAAAAANEGP